MLMVQHQLTYFEAPLNAATVAIVKTLMQFASN
jgi:hypothetical protein